MAELVFAPSQTGEQAVLYGAEGQSSPAWVGYYLPLAAAGEKAPPTLTLQASWSDYWGNPLGQVNGGCYVFLAQQPQAGLLEALEGLLASLNKGFAGRAYRYLLWCPAIQAGEQLGEAGAVPFVRKSPRTESGEVFQGGELTIASLALQVPGGFILEPGSDGASISASIAGSARLVLRQTRGEASRIGTIDAGASVALSGVRAGAVSLGVTLTVASEAVENELASLCTGVKYFYEDQKVVKSQLSPVLGVPSGAKQVPFSALLDPLHPFDETHTRFTFASASSPFSSSLVTNTGIPLTLEPHAGEAGLALAPDWVTPVGGGKQVESSYAVPSGPFTIGAGAPCPAGPLPLLCGISGLEAVSVRPRQEGAYEGDVMTFHTAQAAFAGAFPPVTASLEDPSQAEVAKPLLETKLTTAYVSIAPAKSGAAAQYFAQPHGAPLFGGERKLGLLPLLELPLKEASAPFPLASYHRAAPEPAPDGFAAAELAAFEQAVLSPARRKALLEAKQTSAANGLGHAGEQLTNVLAAGEKATSPQGFIVTLGAGSTWASLLLAQTSSEGKTSTLEFSPVEDAVQAAFQTNQLALVATRRAWQPASFQNQIAIEGWPFHPAVGEGQKFGSYSNVLIAKFCHGALEDLIADPKRWTDAATFNETAEEGLVAVSSWIQSYIGEALTSKAPEFAHFKEILASESWQGILCLKVDVPLANLPPEVGALRAGLPQSAFYAHHLGIEVSKVGESLSIEGSSSLFGLIDYTDPVYATALASGASANTPIPPTQGLAYDFKVLRMLVVFENSEVKEFESTSQVTLNEWFGEKVLKTRMGQGGSVTNSIVITGALQRHDGHPVYSFSSDVDTIFELDSNVLGSVEAKNTTLSTISDAAAGASTFRFAFGGLMDFAAVKALDAFSFGAGAQGSGGLAFKDLFLDLVYDPAAAKSRIFTFDAEKIAFDSSLSVARPTSMYAALPLTLKGLTIGGEGGPQQLGYLDVALPGVKRASLPKTWYGLQFELDLGSPGALAAEAGWSASLLLSWGPGSSRSAEDAAFGVGVHLPGAGGQSKMLSLQGVLKLTIGDLQLRYLPEGAYMLTLRSIALHFLMLQFPPSGATAFYLFGKPGAKPGQRSPLAWYGAYAAEQKKKELTP
jgi:hypothetical protein